MLSIVKVFWQHFISFTSINIREVGVKYAQRDTFARSLLHKDAFKQIKTLTSMFY